MYTPTAILDIVPWEEALNTLGLYQTTKKSQPGHELHWSCWQPTVYLAGLEKR